MLRALQRKRTNKLCQQALAERNNEARKLQMEKNSDTTIDGAQLGSSAFVRPLFWMVLNSLDDSIPVSRETHGPGICGYCGERNEVLKTEPRSQKSYCRKCAPGRETDADWPNVKRLASADENLNYTKK